MFQKDFGTYPHQNKTTDDLDSEIHFTSKFVSKKGSDKWSDERIDSNNDDRNPDFCVQHRKRNAHGQGLRQADGKNQAAPRWQRAANHVAT